MQAFSSMHWQALKIAQIFFSIFSAFFGYPPALSKPFTNILKGFLVFFRIILLNIEEVVFKSCSNLAIMHFGKIRNQPL